MYACVCGLLWVCVWVVCVCVIVGVCVCVCKCVIVGVCVGVVSAYHVTIVCEYHQDRITYIQACVHTTRSHILCGNHHID